MLDFSRSRDRRLPGSFLHRPRGKTLGTRLITEQATGKWNIFVLYNKIENIHELNR
jgi:hypothetical protein